MLLIANFNYRNFQNIQVYILDQFKKSEENLYKSRYSKGSMEADQGKVEGMVGQTHNDDLDLINGNRDQLIGKLQERYGYNKKRAIQELNRRLEEIDQVVFSKYQS